MCRVFLQYERGQDGELERIVRLPACASICHKSHLPIKGNNVSCCGRMLESEIRLCWEDWVVIIYPGAPGQEARRAYRNCRRRDRNH